ncbi:actin-binding FH2 (formin-like) protein [Gracilaria domingensis]|nr:actin-binding FH2 (formin-like) protein [Gracilaria domingensis]
MAMTLMRNMRTMPSVEDAEFIDLDDPNDFMRVRQSPSFEEPPTYWNQPPNPTPQPRLPHPPPQLQRGHNFFDVGLSHPPQPLTIPIAQSLQLPQSHNLSPPVLPQGNTLQLHDPPPNLIPLHAPPPDVLAVHRGQPTVLSMHNAQPSPFIHLPPQPPSAPTLHQHTQQPIHPAILQPPRAPLIPRPSYRPNSIQHRQQLLIPHRIPTMHINRRPPTPPPTPPPPPPPPPYLCADIPREQDSPPSPPPPQKKPSLAELRRRALQGRRRTNSLSLNASQSSVTILGSTSSSAPAISQPHSGDPSVIFEFSSSDEESDVEVHPRSSPERFENPRSTRKRAIEDMKIRAVRLGQCPSMLTKSSDPKSLSERRREGSPAVAVLPSGQSPSPAPPSTPVFSLKTGDQTSNTPANSFDIDSSQLLLQKSGIPPAVQSKGQAPTPKAKLEEITRLRRQIQQIEQRIAQQKTGRQKVEPNVDSQLFTKKPPSPLPSTPSNHLKRALNSSNPFGTRTDSEKRRRYYTDAQRNKPPTPSTIAAVPEVTTHPISPHGATESTSSSLSDPATKPALWKENSVQKSSAPIHVDSANTRLIDDLRTELEESKKKLDSERDTNRLLQAADVSVAEAYAKLGFKRSRLQSVQEELRRAQTDLVTAEEEYRATVSAAKRVKASLGVEASENNYASIDVSAAPAENSTTSQDSNQNTQEASLGTEGNDVQQLIRYDPSPLQLGPARKEQGEVIENEGEVPFHSDPILRPSPYTPSPTVIYNSVLTGLKAYGLRILFLSIPRSFTTSWLCLHDVLELGLLLYNVTASFKELTYLTFVPFLTSCSFVPGDYCLNIPVD